MLALLPPRLIHHSVAGPPGCKPRSVETVLMRHGHAPAGVVLDLQPMLDRPAARTGPPDGPQEQLWIGVREHQGQLAGGLIERAVPELPSQRRLAAVDPDLGHQGHGGGRVDPVLRRSNCRQSLHNRTIIDHANLDLRVVGAQLPGRDVGSATRRDPGQESEQRDQG